MLSLSFIFSLTQLLALSPYLLLCSLLYVCSGALLLSRAILHRGSAVHSSAPILEGTATSLASVAVCRHELSARTTLQPDHLGSAATSLPELVSIAQQLAGVSACVLFLRSLREPLKSSSSTSYSPRRLPAKPLQPKNEGYVRSSRLLAPVPSGIRVISVSDSCRS
jgi:hypothetical protein